MNTANSNERPWAFWVPPDVDRKAYIRKRIEQILRDNNVTVDEKGIVTIHDEP